MTIVKTLGDRPGSMVLVPQSVLTAFPDQFSLAAVRVDGESMQPTLMHGDCVLIDCDTTPRRGEIVVIRNTTHAMIIGRFDQSSRGSWLYKDNPRHTLLRVSRGPPARSRLSAWVALLSNARSPTSRCRR